MEKQEKLHHSVSEAGNLQARIVTEYLDEKGNVVSVKYSDPVTPADTKDLTGWDDKSKDIVEAIIDKNVISDFTNESMPTLELLDMTAEGLKESGLVESVLYDRVIKEDGKIAVRRITRIFDDGIEVSKKYHRSWIMPGDNFENADVISRAVAEKIHTQSVIDAFAAKMAALSVPGGLA